jgi:diguanylate cyclase (GGDEF)-like protein
MEGVAAPLIARVSRRDLARDPWVWLLTAGMIGVFAAMSFGLWALFPQLHHPRMLLLGAALTVVSITIFATKPPPVESPWNHIVLFIVYASVTAAMFAYSPKAGAAALGPAQFIGPLTVVRLVSRTQILAHMVAATCMLFAVIVSGVANLSVSLGILSAILSMWVLAAACMVVLEGSEAQGRLLESLVRSDPLTGLGNRRLLEERITYEADRHSRGNQALSVITLDLNGFKELNDEVGHAAGDDLLRAVAVALRTAARPQDTIVRQGGDEFCVLTPETDALSAHLLGEAIRHAISEIRLHGRVVSTGIGLATCPGDTSDANDLLDIADARLRGDKLRRGQSRGLPVDVRIDRLAS